MKHIIGHVVVPKDKKFVTINKAGVIKARKGGKGQKPTVIGRIKRRAGMRYWVKKGAIYEATAIYFSGKKRTTTRPKKRARKK